MSAKHPESRSLTARGAATRSRIVNAAADLIYEHGVDRTSLDEVMAASGVSKSQLYDYFADKDALVLEVIAFQAERVLAAQQPHLGALDLRALGAWGQAIIRLNEHVHMGGCPLGSLANELANTSESARKRLAGGFGTRSTASSTALRKCASAARLRSLPIRVNWRLLCSLPSRAGSFWPRRPEQAALWKLRWTWQSIASPST